MGEERTKSELEKFIDKHIPFADSSYLSLEELKKLRKRINKKELSLKANEQEIIKILEILFIEDDVYDIATGNNKENQNLEYYKLLLEYNKKEQELRNIMEDSDAETLKKESKALVLLKKKIIKKKLLAEMEEWINCDGHMYAYAPNEWDKGGVCIKCGYCLSKDSYANHLYELLWNVCKGNIKNNGITYKGGRLTETGDYDIYELREIYNQIVAENPEMEGEEITEIMNSILLLKVKGKLKERKL